MSESQTQQEIAPEETTTQKAESPNLDAPAQSEASDPGAQHEEIAQLAYAFWQERGCPEGSDLEDWLRAEEQVRRRHAAGADA